MRPGLNLREKIEGLSREMRADLVSQCSVEEKQTVVALLTRQKGAEAAVDSLRTGGAIEGALMEGLASRVEALLARQSLVGKTIGNIRIEESVGRGGFGEVYRGIDERLGRQVAVKALHASRDSRPEARRRFQREAQLLSKLDHPNICRIYGLIEQDEADYLVLEYIEGKPLLVATEGVGLETQLDMLSGIASALEGAHASGIIHRDLKPENVLVSSDGKARVLDFGIARQEIGPLEERRDRTEVDSQESELSEVLTQAGFRLGTVRYMSPEQARGDALTTASDCYSFGVVAHEVLSGEPAYEQGSSESLILRVQRGATKLFTHQDPDLQSLVRELEREEASTRPTPADVLARLGAVSDKPRLRRRRSLQRAVLLGLALATLAVGFAWRQSRVRAASDLSVAQELIAGAKNIEWRMRVEYLSPRHNIERARRPLMVEAQSLRARLDTLGPTAAAPGRSALGRVALSMGDLDLARQEVEAAWANGYRTPEAAYTLGRILSRLYRDQVEADSLRYSPSERAARLVVHRAALGERAAEFLELGRESVLETPIYVDSLLAVSEGRYEEALELLESIDLPWFYERYLLEGWIELRLLRSEFNRGSVEAVMFRAIRARDAYARAVSIGRSAPQAYLGLCRANAELLYRGTLDAQGVVEASQQALESCNAALEIAPGSFDALYRLGETHFYLAQRAWDTGEDGEERLEVAYSVAQRALELRPENSAVTSLLVKILWRRAVEHQQRGVDPGDVFREAALLADRLTARSDSSIVELQSAVLLSMDHGLYAISQGNSPMEILAKGEAASRRSLAIERTASVLANQGILHMVQAEYQIDHGLPVAESVGSGLEKVNESLEALPGHHVLLRVRGNLQRVMFRDNILRGAASEESLEASRASFEEAIASYSSFVWAKVELAHLELLWAENQIENGALPTAALARVQELCAAMEGNDDVVAERNLLEGWRLLLEGRARLTHGLSAESLWGRAFSALEVAAAENGLDHRVPKVAARLELLKAEQATRATVRAAFVARAHGYVDKALEIRPDDAEAYRLRAQLWLLARAPGSDSSDAALIAKATESCKRALELNPLLGPDCLPGSAHESQGSRGNGS